MKLDSEPKVKDPPLEVNRSDCNLRLVIVPNRILDQIIRILDWLKRNATLLVVKNKCEK